MDRRGRRRARGTDRRPLAAAAAVAALAFAVFDVAEVAHQLDVSRSGLALLAAAIAFGHVAAAGLSLGSMRSAQPAHGRG